MRRVHDAACACAGEGEPGLASPAAVPGVEPLAKAAEGGVPKASKIDSARLASSTDVAQDARLASFLANLRESEYGRIRG